MTQEMFWTLSVANFIVVAIVAAVNIIITIFTAMKLRKINKKVGIDLTMHKELMNALCEFVLSIGDDKIIFPKEEEFKEDFPILIHSNCAHMKNMYRKLSLYIDYCYTNNEKFKLELECIYNNYCKAFEDLGTGISTRRHLDNLKSESEKANEIYRKANDKIANYHTIITNQEIKDGFFEQLNLLIKNETDYIKGK